ncbi:hypothetical protein ACLOJK_023218 [Asimina triloba]
MAEAPVHALPQDFIDKQKAYFAEIDAFELLEEEVSITELDWSGIPTPVNSYSYKNLQGAPGI